MKESATARAGTEPLRVMVVGDTCVSKQGMAAILRRDKRYHLCGGTHGFDDAGELIRKRQTDILLIEPFLVSRFSKTSGRNFRRIIRDFMSP